MIEQGTEAWRLARVGKLTASRIADAVAKTKTGWGASRANLMAQLIAERLTGEPSEGFTTPAMQWGIDMEADARTAYEFQRDCAVEPAGYVVHPKIADSGASPDGFVAADGLIEIKCPNTSTQIDTLLGGSVPGKYVLQMQWQMACTGRQWCDFVSYDPRLPAPLNLYIVRVPRDDGKIAELTGDVQTFISELDNKMTALRERFGVKEAA